jgi:DNA-binding protein HU-beta
MNKSDLVNAIVQSGNGSLSKAAAERALETVTTTITKEVVAGGTVTLVGFGTFKASQRAARSGRNPATGEAIQIAASTAPKFVPGKEFKDAVNAAATKAKKVKK